MGGIGVQRIAKLTKHLPATGWRPVVVTAPAWSFRMQKDPSLLGEMPPDLEIHRPFFFDSRKILPGDLAKVIAPLEKRLFFPDKFRIWNAGVIRWMASYLAHHRADAVFINVPPFSGLNLAEEIKRKFRVPVILGLRDAFSFNNYLLLNPDPAASAAAAELEGRAFSAADAMVFTTPHMMRKYGDLFPACRPKMSVITNGYDEGDFTGLDSGGPLERSPSGGGEFTVGYNGSHSRLAPLAPLVNALCAIHETHGIRMRLNIATTDPLPKFKAKFPKLFDYGLADFKGFLPHRESLRNLAGCNLLAFMFADSPATEGAYSGKVFEYLRAGKPILLLHRRDSDIARLIADTRSGTTIDIDDPADVVRGLLHYHDLWKAGRLTHTPDIEKIRAFDYRNLTRSLAELFNQTAEKRP
jgi:hypothetical protein